MAKSRQQRRRERYTKPAPAPRVARWNREPCNACGQPVILAEADTGGGRLQPAILGPVPDPAGALVRRDDGYLVRDPAGALDGTRWRWHNCPARNHP